MRRLGNFFKILSDETRLRILILLLERELCVCEMQEIMDVSQPKISKHLAKLRDSMIIKDQRKEQYVYYSLDIVEDLYMYILKKIKENIEKFPILVEDSSRVDKILDKIRG